MYFVISKESFVTREYFYDKFLSKCKHAKTMHLLYLTTAVK